MNIKYGEVKILSDNYCKKISLKQFVGILTINFFRILFLTSIIGKLIFPITFFSWVFNLLKAFELNFILQFPGIYTAILTATIFFEILILAFSFRYDKNVFSIMVISFFFITSSTIISAYFLGLSGDCGCFGKILVFDNTIYKVLFNVFCVILALGNHFFIVYKAPNSAQ